MTKFYLETNEYISQKNYNQNIIVNSFFKDIEKDLVSPGFGIKYVVAGAETYLVNNDEINLKTNQYILTSENENTRIQIKSDKDVEGICINILPNIVEQVAGYYLDNESSDPIVLKQLLLESVYYREKREGQFTQLGYFLQTQLKSYIKQKNFEPSLELFYKISEFWLADFISSNKRVLKIPAVKKNTQYDLYKRLLMAKEFIDDNYSSALSIEKISQVAAISEYHFFRLFKKCFEITPYQYIQYKRLNKSRVLINTGVTVTEAALQSGFSDIHIFSKAFKKQYGVSPRQMKYA